DVEARLLPERLAVEPDRQHAHAGSSFRDRASHPCAPAPWSCPQRPTVCGPRAGIASCTL
ncbi:MAG: hypothetical protein AVDCRST_MAG87-1411, partial [uncultured Thermomicrobiales bacterium]